MSLPRRLLRLSQLPTCTCHHQLVTARRAHSTSSAPPKWSHLPLTSAGTRVPFASSSKSASNAFLPSDPDANFKVDGERPRATEGGLGDLLSVDEQRVLERILRVDQAGEVAANYIYKGQLEGLGLRDRLARKKGSREERDIVQAMWDGEKKHIAVLDALLSLHGARPTVFYPLAKAAGHALGFLSAMGGKEATMACTEAVETVIGEHYNDQLKALSPILARLSSLPASPARTTALLTLTQLQSILVEFRDDELEHLDTAVKNDAQLAPAHAMMSALVMRGCKGAIWLTERV